MLAEKIMVRRMMRCGLYANVATSQTQIEEETIQWSLSLREGLKVFRLTSRRSIFGFQASAVGQVEANGTGSTTVH